MTDTQAPETGSFADKATDRVLRTMIGAVLRLPYDKRVPLMGWLVRRVIGPLAGYRKRAVEMLTLIYPDMPQAEVAATANRVLDNAGRTIIENYSGADFSARIQRATIHGDGLPALEAAVKAGQPVIFITGHYGNHEAPRQWLTAQGYDIGGLYRPMKNPYFNDHYARTMTELSGPVFPQGRRGTAGFARHLKNGGLGTLLFDVHVGNAPLIPFMGQPAFTATSAAELAQKFGAVMIPYFGRRQANGLDFDIFIEPPIAPADPVAMMTEATRRLEHHVSATPDQWFWVHRRWKPQRIREAATIAPGPGS